jgi:uncharacterized protein YaaW (UPF0174 family)
VKLRINERKESYQIRITQNLLSSIHKLIWSSIPHRESRRVWMENPGSYSSR